MKEFDATSFKEEGHKLIDRLAEYLDSVSKGENYPVLPNNDPDELADLFYKRLHSTEKSNFLDIIEEYIQTSNHLHHPGYIGHQCTSPLPFTALTHLTASLFNNGSAVYEMGPANIAMERALTRHLSAKIGYSNKSDGILTHGGSAGNLTALLAARQAKSEYNIWEEGVKADALPGFIVSEQSHYSISRNLKIMGLGEAASIPIKVDTKFAMRTDLLEKTLHEAKGKGIKVIGVVANACSTATGTYDNLEAIASFCEDNNLWMHVDGAHGMGVLMSEKYRHLIKGIERADSVIIDFHKMFLVTGLNTAVLFKDGDRSYETFAQKASYLFELSHDKEWYNSAKRTLECTKSSLGFHTYTMFRYYGDKFFGDYVDQMYDLTKDFNRLIVDSPDFESIGSPDSNILCFRFTGINSSQDIDSLNKTIRERILKRGNYYIVQAELLGHVWLRTTIINPLTKLKDLKNLLNEIRNCLD